MSEREDFFAALNEHHTWDFSTGEKVKIIAGKYGGTEGTVTAVNVGCNLDCVAVRIRIEGQPEDICFFTPDSLDHLEQKQTNENVDSFVNRTSRSSNRFVRASGNFAKEINKQQKSIADRVSDGDIEGATRRAHPAFVFGNTVAAGVKAWDSSKYRRDKDGKFIEK